MNNFLSIWDSSYPHIFALLVNTTWQITLLVMLVFLSIFLLRIRSAAMRYSLWLMTLFSPFVLPLLNLSMPALNIQDLESELYRINPQTAKATLVGTMNQKQVDGLSFSQNGTLYGVTSIIGGGYDSQLIEVDIKTGKTTPINVGLGIKDIDAVAIGPEDRVIIANGSASGVQFYQIDLTIESNLVPINPIPHIIGRDIEGLTFSPDGFLYGTTNVEQKGDGICYFVRIDPKTFKHIILGILEFGSWNLASQKTPALQ